MSTLVLLEIALMILHIVRLALNKTSTHAYKLLDQDQLPVQSINNDPHSRETLPHSFPRIELVPRPIVPFFRAPGLSSISLGFRSHSSFVSLLVVTRSRG